MNGTFDVAPNITSGLPRHRRARVLLLDHVGVLGGAELALVDMARHFGPAGRVLLLADGPLRAAIEAVGAEVSVVPASAAVSGVRRGSGLRRSLRAVPYLLGLAQRVARAARGAGVVWANSQKAFVVGALGAWLARRPLVWHLHDILTADHFSPANRRVAAALANRFAARVVVCSRACGEAFVASGGRADLLTVVLNGIDPAPFAGPLPSRPAADALRRELGVPGPPTVGVFGRLTPWKGQDVLIRALASLPGVHALLVGDALFGEGDYERFLRRLAAESGAGERVHFAGFRHDVPALMRAVDVVAHTSTAPEPFGRVIVEGMLASKPVVATAAGGVTEIAEHGRHALLVPPGDAKALTRALAGLFGDPARAAALAAAGRERAFEAFTLGRFLRQIDAVVTEVSAGRPAPKVPAVEGVAA